MTERGVVEPFVLLVVVELPALPEPSEPLPDPEPEPPESEPPEELPLPPDGAAVTVTSIEALDDENCRRLAVSVMVALPAVTPLI
jgi:hypothetical protein